MTNPRAIYAYKLSEFSAKLYNGRVMDEAAIREFQQVVWAYYHDNGRHDLPWRQPEAAGNFDPYKIMVSEIMLQQTQVGRVVEKYRQFLALFPTIDSLAVAELGKVLRAWSGLGYNRRAKFLHQAAQITCDSLNGKLPRTIDELTSLPGIGKNTAGAISAYSFNSPVVFIETNIRTVYIHHFFNDTDAVNDKEILNMLSISLDRENPREWYWALMDYGSYLKKSGVRSSRQSKHYTMQSKFEGSKRQIRGEVLRQLGTRGQTLDELSRVVQDERLQQVVNDLLTEGLIQERHGRLTL